MYFKVIQDSPTYNLLKKYFKAKDVWDTKVNQFCFKYNIKKGSLLISLQDNFRPFIIKFEGELDNEIFEYSEIHTGVYRVNKNSEKSKEIINEIKELRKDYILFTQAPIYIYSTLKTYDFRLANDCKTYIIEINSYITKRHRKNSDLVQIKEEEFNSFLDN